MDNTITATEMPAETQPLVVSTVNVTSSAATPPRLTVSCIMITLDQNIYHHCTNREQGSYTIVYTDGQALKCNQVNSVDETFVEVGNLHPVLITCPTSGNATSLWSLWLRG
jgi:hypothetical protein